ncbi:MAG: hypothetical protein QM765_12270 [Myxococcales bacterium]
MNGSIQGRHVLRHSVTIVREFGALCLLRCLKAVLLRERTTFLNVAFHK